MAKPLGVICPESPLIKESQRVIDKSWDNLCRMAKASLEFNFPDDQELFETSLNAVKYKCQIEDIELVLRKYRKYEELANAEREFFDKLDDEIREILSGD